MLTSIKKIRTKFTTGILILSLFSFSFPMLQAVADASQLKEPYDKGGYRFGINEKQDKRVSDSESIMQLPFREAWAYDLRKIDENGNPTLGTGNVQGQPIIVNDDETGIKSIFVQAGKDLIKLDYRSSQDGPVQWIKKENITDSELPSASAPTYARTPRFSANDTGTRIYQATRDHKFMAFDAFDLSRYWATTVAAGNRPDLRYRITSSPFVRAMDNNVVISLGTAAGDLTGYTSQYYADDGFFAFSDVGTSVDNLNTIRTEGEVTGSPLETNGIIYNTVNTGNNVSYLLQYGISNNYMGNVDSLTPFNAGVPTSITRDGNFLYVADRKGSLYKIDSKTMTQKDKNDGVAGNSLVLEDPAISDEYVYVPVRHYKSQNTGGNGAVVVYRKADLNVVKVIELDSPLKNHILYVSDPASKNPNGYIVVFESNGNLRFYDEKNDWNPLEWFEDDEGNKHEVVTVPNTGEQYTSPQLVMADGMLLVVDGAGIMHAYVATRPHNLYIKDLRIVGKEIEDVRRGETVTVQATLGNSSNDDFYQVPTKIYVNGQPAGVREETLLNNTPRTKGENVVTFDITVPSDLPMITVTLNPDKNNPSDEYTFEDNTKMIVSPVDIAITSFTLDKTSIEKGNPTVNAIVKVKASQIGEKRPNITIRTDLTVQTTRKAESLDIELPIGEERTFTIPMDLSSTGIDFDALDKLGFIAKVNPRFDIFEPLEPRDIRENNFSNAEYVNVKHDYDLVMESLSVKGTVQVGEKATVTGIVTNDSSYPMDNVLVRFDAGGKKVYETRADFAAGQTKNISFVWTAPNNPTAVSMAATVDPDLETRDGNRKNNVKNALVNVIAQPTRSVEDTKACGNWDVTYSVITGYNIREVTTSSVDSDGNEYSSTTYETDYSSPIWEDRTVTYNECQAASIDVNTKQGITTDPANPKESDRESRGSWAIIPYAQQNELDPNKVTRAGYGFEVKVSTDYSTDWETLVPQGYEGTAVPFGGTYTGANSVVAHFYNSRGDYETSIDLEKTRGNGISDVWELPMQTRSTLLGDQISDRKYYTEVTAPDGDYTVVIVASGGGATGVSVSKEMKVHIWGSYYDDSQNVKDRK